MKKSLLASLLFAITLWFGFAAVLLGSYQPTWLPEKFLKLAHPSTWADFGQAFSALEGLISSMALMLAVLAVLIQVRQSSDSNIIGAFGARLQFLLAEYDRLDKQIASYISKNSGPGYDKNLVDNMVAKRKDYLEESKKIDNKIQELLSKI